MNHAALIFGFKIAFWMCVCALAVEINIAAFLYSFEGWYQDAWPETHRALLAKKTDRFSFNIVPFLILFRLLKFEYRESVAR